MLPSQGKAFNKGRRFLSDYDKKSCESGWKNQKLLHTGLAWISTRVESLRGNTSVRQHEGPGNSGSSSSIVDKQQLQAEN